MPVGRNVAATPGKAVSGGQVSRFLSALFSVVHFCDEAMHIWAERLPVPQSGFSQGMPPGPIYSNIPLKPEWRLPEGTKGRYRGIAQLTLAQMSTPVGARIHDRSEPSPETLQEEANKPHVGVILLDIVLDIVRTLIRPRSTRQPSSPLARRHRKLADR